MAELVRTVITDLQAEPLPVPTVRDVTLPRQPGKVDAVIGMRRVGKSWLLLSRMRELLDAGVPRSRMLHFEFEDERLDDLRTADLHLIEDAFYALNPDSHGQQCWYFFDEIQNAPGWDRFVRRLLGNPRLQLAVTGSSAKLLSTEIATSLRGRSLTTEVMPFSFREALRHRQIDAPSAWPTSQAVRGRLRSEFDRYLAVGGFPEVQDDAPHRERVLQGYLDVTILRDVIERHKVANAPLLRALVRRLLRSTGGRISVNSMAQDLKSVGFTFAKEAIYALQSHVEDAFLVFLLPVYSRSEKRRQVNPRKCYGVDHALVRACVGRRGEDVGHWLENMVYVELRRRATVHGYHLTASGREVDFVAGDAAGDELHLVQACANLGEAATRAHEVEALEEAMGEVESATATIVTIAEEDEIRIGGKRVRVVPAWRWLLELPE